MTDSQALLSEADKLAKVADEIGRSYATELARVLRDLERELRALALDALSRGSKGVLSRAVRAAKLRKQIQRALTAAGYEHLTETATSVSLDKIVRQLEKVRGAAKLAAFTSDDLTRILAMKALAKTDLLGQGDAIAHTLWRTFVQGLFSQRPVRRLKGVGVAVGGAHAAAVSVRGPAGAVVPAGGGAAERKGTLVAGRGQRRAGRRRGMSERGANEAGQAIAGGGYAVLFR